MLNAILRKKVLTTIFNIQCNSAEYYCTIFEKEIVIKMKKYRVEAFIIPVYGKTEFGVNQIDDVKLANKLKDQSVTASEHQESDVHTLVVENNLESFHKSVNAHQSETGENHESVSEFSRVFFEINEHIYDEIVIPEKKKMMQTKSTKTATEYAKAVDKINEPIYDEPFVGTCASLNKRNNDNNYDVPPQANWILGSSKYRRFGIVAPKLPNRSTSSLKSITEDNESFVDDTLPAELCCHGNKNGCLPSSKRPEDISEEIFKENWMQRLDALRKLETLLKDKEIALQSRERLLFKKEKELRILERLVKDKMKQTEMYAKRHKKTSSSESIAHEQNTESKSSDNSQDFIKHECSLKPFILMSRNHLETRSSEDKHKHHLKNPPNSKSSLMAHELESKGTSSRSRSRTLRNKRSDDLDSTLSADIGDSSFVITARKFDPGTLKRPTAFIRSASERRPKLEQGTVWPMLTSLTEKDEQNLLNKIEEKTLKKISQNILAIEDQATKFLNYGPIDKSSETFMRSSGSKELINQKRYSYLNLESTHKPMKSNLVSKQRPVSWSENTDDWLMKKRQAYNLATKKNVTHPHEKENFDGQTNANKSTKVLKKKETSNKKFSIFR